MMKKNCTSWELYNFTTEDCMVKCEVNHTYFKENDTCKCFPKLPYFNTTNRTCTAPSCPNGTKWNPHLLKCSPATMNCNKSELFDFSTEKCVKKCQENITYNNVSGHCECPPEKPAFDNKTLHCVDPNCSKGYKYNAHLLKCSLAPGSVNVSSWEFYNFTTEEVVKKC